MAYVGRQSGKIGKYVRCNTITPDGSTTTFALTNVSDNTAVIPGLDNNVLCSLSGVIQAPGSGNAFTISGSNIIFSAAPDAADVVDFVLVLGETLSVGTPSDGTVTLAKMAVNSVDSDQYVDGSIDEIHLADDAVTMGKLNLTYDNRTTATGDASTVAFTISASRTVNDVLVYVNGICLVPTTDYTISSTTLTFVTAPAASAEIAVRYLPK